MEVFEFMKFSAAQKFFAVFALMGLVISTPAISNEIQESGQESVVAIVPIELALSMGVNWTQLTSEAARVEIARSYFERISESSWGDQVSEEIIYETFADFDASQPPVSSGKTLVPNQDGGSGSGDSRTAYRVAVLDTGVERNHPYLVNKIAEEVCFTTNKSCPNNEDFQQGPGASATSDSHGSHVSGIIVGNRTTIDGKVYEGIAPGAEVISIKVCNGDCRSGLPSSSILRGLQWVLDNQAEYNIVSVNMSFGGLGDFRGSSGCDARAPATTNIIAQLWEAGVAPIAATGNGFRYSQISHPACVSKVISVGSTTSEGKISEFSDVSSSTDILAQGSDVLSAVNNGQMMKASGTSMATPVVSGAIAVMRSADPDNTLDNYLSVMRSQADVIDDVIVPDLRLLKLDRAVNYMLQGSSPEPPSLARLTQLNNDFAELTWEPPTNLGENLGVDSYVISFGNKTYTVDASQKSLELEIQGPGSLIAYVASSKNSIVSDFIASPPLQVTTMTTRPEALIRGFQVTQDACTRGNSYNVRLQVSHRDSTNITGFAAWDTSDPRRIFRGSKMIFVNEWDSNVEVVTSRNAGQIRVAAIYKDGSTGASQVVSYGNPHNDVSDGPIAVDFEKITEGWLIRWLDPLTANGLNSPKIRVYAGEAIVGTFNLGVQEAVISDPSHSLRKLEVCLAGTRTHGDYDWVTGSLRSNFDTASVLGPTKISRISVSSPSQKRISVSFSAASASSSAPVSQYQIRIGSVTSTSKPTIRSLSSAVPHPGEYVVAIRARNSNGFGPWAKSKVTVQGDPAAVLNNLKLTPGSRQVAVRWSVARSQSPRVVRQEITVGGKKFSVTQSARSFIATGIARGPANVCVVTFMNSGAKISVCSKAVIK